MKLKTLIPLISLSLVLCLACQNNSENQSSLGWSAETASGAFEADDKSETKDTKISRKLIKKGELKFHTSDINKTRETIFNAVQTHKAYISSDQEFNSDYSNRNTLIIRVPSKNFDIFVNDASTGVEKFDKKEIQLLDVTEDYLDSEARVKTKKELEQRYIEILEKANTIAEILEIEKEIGKLRAEIESAEGRLKYLQDQISFSTVSITFYESKESETAFGRKFKDAFSLGSENFVLFFVGLTQIWPFALLLLAGIFWLRFYRRRKR